MIVSASRIGRPVHAGNISAIRLGYIVILVLYNANLAHHCILRFVTMSTRKSQRSCEIVLGEQPEEASSPEGRPKRRRKENETGGAPPAAVDLPEVKPSSIPSVLLHEPSTGLRVLAETRPSPPEGGCGKSPQTVSPHLPPAVDVPPMVAPVVGSAAPTHNLHQKSQHSDDEDPVVSQHLIAKTNEIIGGRFQIINLMGTGTFGKVYKCRDFKHNDLVALKCIRRIDKYIESAKVESKILNSIYKKQRDMLQTGTLEREYCVKLYTHVNHGPYYCMAFEPLGPSLLDLLKHNCFQGFPLSFVQQIGYQLCRALNFMSKIDLVHTDIKLENILFASGDYSTFSDWGLLYEQDFYKRRFEVCPLRFPRSASIKIIDFGGANYLPSGKTKTSIVNTRQYRGPEVTLELGWSFPSDIWSVGCMLAEIWMGELLFPTHDNLEHLCMMETMLGPFPQWMKSNSPVRRNFFNSNLQLRTNELGAHSRKKMSGLPKLAAFKPDLLAYRQSKLDTNGADIPGEGFVELLQGLLQLDPRERLLPRQAVDNKFFRHSVSLPPGCYPAP